MAKEFLVYDTIASNLVIKAPALPAAEPSNEPWHWRYSRLLREICSPNEGEVKLFEGQPFRPVYANNRDPEYSCSWAEKADGSGSGQVFLAWVDKPRMRVRVKIKFSIAQDQSMAWLAGEFNPTSLTVGHNVHPAAFIDPRTGVAHLWPSSRWDAMTRTFRLVFDFLEAMSGPEPLFDAATRLTIERGHINLARSPSR